MADSDLFLSYALNASFAFSSSAAAAAAPGTEEEVEGPGEEVEEGGDLEEGKRKLLKHGHYCMWKRKRPLLCFGENTLAINSEHYLHRKKIQQS